MLSLQRQDSGFFNHSVGGFLFQIRKQHDRAEFVSVDAGSPKAGEALIRDHRLKKLALVVVAGDHSHRKKLLQGVSRVKLEWLQLTEINYAILRLLPAEHREKVWPK